jgi:hypothetical protein
LADLEAEFGGQVAVVTICLGASAEEARAALAEAEADVLTLLDEDWVTSDDYQVGGTPITYLIGRTGTIIASHVGYGGGTADLLRAEIEALVEE